MIQTLPKEVLRVITDKLDFDDKLNLCKTCQKLYEHISKTNLYETLIIRKNTEAIIRIFQDRILDGAQVQVLDVRMDDLSDELYSNLADIFPNVTRVIIGSGLSPEIEIREEHVTGPLLKWKNSIRKYDSFSDWEYFENELFRSIFPRLEDLNLADAHLIPGRKMGFDPLFLSKGITNAPTLTNLSLYKCDISIDSLEEIHLGCPYLRRLELQKVILIVDNSSLPVSIIPASTISYLNISPTIFDMHGLFLDYIIYKYPNLQDLTVCYFESDEWEIEQLLNGYYPSTAGTISNILEENYQLYISKVNEFRRTVKAYIDGVPLFISRLPKSIKSLKLYGDIFKNVVQILSTLSTTLSDLTLISSHSVVDTDQLKYVKSLKSLKALHIPMSFSPQTYELDFISDTITTLKIEPRLGLFSITWILSVFPSLESLSVFPEPYLHSENLIYLEKKYYEGRTYPKLQVLDLSYRVVYLEPFNILKQIFPNLKELSCVLILQDEQTVYTLDVTCWNLNSFKIVLCLDDEELDYYITITVPDGSQQFLQQKHTLGLYRIQEVPNFMEDKPRIDIICNYINEFSVNGHKYDL